MPKKLAAGLILILALCLASCSLGKISYTKEFLYLPSYKKMTLEKFAQPSTSSFGTATYIIKGAKYDDVLAKYSRVLIRDGWEITSDNKPKYISIKKAEHQTFLITEEIDSGVRLTIISK